MKFWKKQHESPEDTQVVDTFGEEAQAESNVAEEQEQDIAVPQKAEAKSSENAEEKQTENEEDAGSKKKIEKFLYTREAHEQLEKQDLKNVETVLSLVEPKSKLRRIVPAVLLTALYLVFMVLMFSNAQASRRDGIVMSLRYNTPLEADTVANAKREAATPEKAALFTASYWSDSRSENIATLRTEVETPVLFVDGDMEHVINVDFLRGTYPSAIESRGLALSESLAWELLGGIDVVGAEIEWKDTIYTVRGVFKGQEHFMLAQVDASKISSVAFRGIELAGTVLEGDPKDVAREFVLQLGLSEPEDFVNVSVLPMLIAMFAWLPAVICIIWAFIKLLGFLGRLNYWAKQAVLFGVLILAAVMLPKAMAMLPGWVIPNQWSDMEHWSLLFKDISARITQWLSLVPYQGDVLLKKQLILQMVLFVPALVTTLSMLRRWTTYMRKTDLLVLHKQAEELVARNTPENEVPPAEETDDIDVLKYAGEQSKKAEIGSEAFR